MSTFLSPRHLEQHRRGEGAFGELLPWCPCRFALARARRRTRSCATAGWSRSGSDRPGPDRPISVSVRAPSARPKRTSSAKPRVVSAADGAGAEPAAGDDAGRDGEHVLGRAADLDAAHVGRMIGPEGARAERLRQRRARALSSRAASVTAVGRPRATSAAKLGPDRIAGIAAGAHSAMISVMNLCVPCSMPLAQAMTGVRGARSRASALTHGAHRLRRHHQQDRVVRRAASASSRRHRDGVVDPHAGQEACSRAASRVARRCRRRTPTASRSRPARAATLASAVPQAPPPSTAMRSNASCG